jgi:hypothetical protein
MRQMNQDGSHGQEEAAELLSGVNAANSQFVLTEVALKTSWEAEPNEDERERHQNAFRHARSVLQAMTADRGIAGTQALTAEQALDADQRANPENPTAALADDFAARSSEYDPLEIKPAPPGHLFLPWGSPFHAPGLLSCDPGASFCALGSTFCTPTKLNLYHISTTNYFLNAQR